MKKDLTIQLHCTDFPGRTFEYRQNVFLAVQKKKELVWETTADSIEKIFEIPVQVDKGKDEQPNFLGPFVFGKTGDKFLYLVWYNKVGTEREMFRRAKIKLNELSWEAIDQAVDQSRPLKAHIKLKDKVGCPVCASLKERNIKWEI